MSVPLPPTPILFALIAAGITSLGLIAVILADRWTQKRVGLLAAFAAGALVTVALLHLAPSALAATPRAPVLMLCGFAGGFLLNRGVLAISESASRARLAAGLTPALGIAFHSFVDGVAYAVTFSVDFTTGLLTATGLILHEAPEGIIVFTLLRASGFSLRAAAGIAFLAAAVTTPLGAAAAYPFVSSLNDAALGDVFAVAAGVLLYVGAGHLLPHVERERSVWAVPAAAAGALTAFAMESTHDHDHNDPHHGHDHVHGFSSPARHGPEH